MKGYLSPEEAGGGRVPVERRAEIYRDPDNGQEITVETDGRTVPVGVADVTVSRKKDGTAPVVVQTESECIEVHNEGNSNGVVVRTDGETREVEEGFSERVRRDAVIELGYQTELRLTVEREARVEVQGGDFVAGNKTEVSDSVLNRSNVDGGESADTPSGQSHGGRVEDSTVNRSTVTGNVEDSNVMASEIDGHVEDSVVKRSTVGEVTSANDGVANEDVTDRATGGGSSPTERGDDNSNTRNVCQVHGITYTGQTCPKCVAASSEEKTKFCLYCGDPIPERAMTCPECGKDLPDQ